MNNILALRDFNKYKMKKNFKVKDIIFLNEFIKKKINL